MLEGLPRPLELVAHGGAPDRRGRAPAGVPQRAVVTVPACSPESCASSAWSSRRRRRAAAVRSSCARPRPPRALRVGDSVAINGCCLTATAIDDGDDRLPRRSGDDPTHDAREPRVRRAGQRRAGASRRRRARRALRPGSRRRGRPHPVGRGGGRGASRLRRGARRRPALLRREGLDHRRRRVADGRRARRRRVRRRARPAHAGRATTLVGPASRGRPSTSRPTSSRSTSNV